MSTTKSSRMLAFINYRMRVTISDTRSIVGTFLAFDRHMNLVLGDAEEFRRIKGSGSTKANPREEKRALGLVLIRGECVVAVQVESPPRTKPKPKNASNAKVRGVAVGRGAPIGAASSAGAPSSMS